MHAGAPPIGSRESTALAQPKSVGPDDELREAASVPDGLVGERAARRDLEEAGGPDSVVGPAGDHDGDAGRARRGAAPAARA